jgi:hypothetical protein
VQCASVVLYVVYMLKNITTSSIAFFFLIVSVVGSACGAGVSPPSGVSWSSPPPVHFLAVRAYTGDVKALVAAGGHRVGTMRATGDTYSNVLKVLARSASCRGASHFIVTYSEHVREARPVRFIVEVAVYSVPTGRIGTLTTALRPTEVWCHTQ